MKIFEPARQRLVDSSKPSDRDDICRNLGELETFTRKIRVNVGGASIPLEGFMAEAAARETNGKTDVVVHAQWPWQDTAKNGLRQSAINHFRLHNGTQVHECVEQWLDRYRQKLDETLHACPRLVEIEDPLTYKPSRSAHAPIFSASNGPYTATGFLPEFELARLLMMEDTISRNTEIRVHGASYACCPTGFATQLFAALHLGVYIPNMDENTWSILGNARKVLDYMKSVQLMATSRIRMGVLMDCYQKMEGISIQETVTASLSDEQTCVHPYEDDVSMKAPFMR